MKKNPRAAAAAVLVLLIFNALACSIPIGNGAPLTPTAALPTQPEVGASPTPPLAATVGAEPTLPPELPAPTATGITPVAPETGEVLIYLVALEDNGASGPVIGCGDSLIEVRRPADSNDQPIAAALQALLSVKSQFYGESGLYNALYQSELAVENWEVTPDGLASVMLTGQIKLGGTCDAPRFKAQIVQTIASASKAQWVEVFINGEPIDEVLTQR